MKDDDVALIPRFFPLLFMCITC